MKRLLPLVFALALALGLAGYSMSGTDALPTPPSSQNPAPQSQSSEEEPVELIVFAAASMTEAMNQIAQRYQEVAPHVSIVYTFDSSGTLKTQIEEGAGCDLFISAAQTQMNQLDASQKEAGGNLDGLDFVLQGTRVDLVENEVVLVVPDGNPAGISSFEDVASGKVQLVAMGNSDVPAGQYAQEIFAYMGVWDQLNRQQKITFSSNVKEVASQVAQAAVDCGVVYATDASSAGLEVVARAPEGSCQPAVYPAAVLNITRHEEEARAFLIFLRSEACAVVFASAGFSIPA